MISGKNGREVESLRMGQRFRLMKWFEQSQEAIVAEGLTAAEVAERFNSQDHGFTVNKAHVTSAARNMVPRFVWPRRRVSVEARGRYKKLLGRVGDLEFKLAEMAGRVETLERELGMAKK